MSGHIPLRLLHRKGSYRFDHGPRWEAEKQSWSSRSQLESCISRPPESHREKDFWGGLWGAPVRSFKSSAGSALTGESVVQEQISGFLRSSHRIDKRNSEIVKRVFSRHSINWVLDPCGELKVQISFPSIVYSTHHGKGTNFKKFAFRFSRFDCGDRQC